MGFKADVIVWDFEAKEPYATFTLHKVKVEALAFSPSDKYLVTLGGKNSSRSPNYHDVISTIRTPFVFLRCDSIFKMITCFLPTILS